MDTDKSMHYRNTYEHRDRGSMDKAFVHLQQVEVLEIKGEVHTCSIFNPEAISNW